MPVLAAKIDADAHGGTPVIDGVRDRIWDRSEKNVIGIVDHVLVPSESKARGEFSLLWDDVNLYVFVTVDKHGDGIYAADGEGQSDSVEIFFTDTCVTSGHNNVTDEKSPLAGCFRVDCGGNLSGYGGYYEVIRNYVKYAYKETGKGKYSVEIAIPFFNTEPKENDKVSLELQINVNSEGKGRDGIIAWHSADCMGWRDSAEHGIVLLTDPAKKDDPAPPTGDLLMIAVPAAAASGIVLISKKRK